MFEPSLSNQVVFTWLLGSETKGDKPTSLRRAYHESGAWGRFLYRLIGTFFHEELMLRECDTLALYNMLGGRTKTELESMGTPVTLPLRILGGDAKNFHTFLQSGDPEDKHDLVIHTTHKTYVKKLHSELFQKGSRAVIMDIFTD